MLKDLLKRLSPNGRKYLQYFLAFFVALVIGLAPVLGVTTVPAIGSLFPLNLRATNAAFAGVLMALPAVGVHFFAGDKFNVRRLKTAFAVVFLMLFVGVVALYVVYTSFVAHVQIGGRLSAAYVVGPTMRPDCPCVAQKRQISSCIGPIIDTNPAHVEDCYPREDIVARKKLMSVLYLLVMFSLGVLIGLVVVREQLPERQRRAAKTNAR